MDIYYFLWATENASWRASVSCLVSEMFLFVVTCWDQGCASSETALTLMTDHQLSTQQLQWIIVQWSQSGESGDSLCLMMLHLCWWHHPGQWQSWHHCNRCDHTLPDTGPAPADPTTNTSVIIIIIIIIIMKNRSNSNSGLRFKSLNIKRNGILIFGNQDFW